MHQAFEKAGKASLWILITLALLVGMGLFALQLPVVKRAILAEVVEQTNAALVGEMQAERLSGPLLWSATLHDVRLRDRRGNPVVRIEELKAGYSIFKLATGNYDLRSVEVRGPTVLLGHYADGALNAGEIVAPTPSESRLKVNNVSVVDGLLLFAMNIPEASNAEGPDRAPAGEAGGPSTEGDRPVSSLIQEAFEQTGSIDPEALHAAFRQQKGESLLQAVLADSIRLSASYLTTPDGMMEVTVDDMEFGLDANTFSHPLGAAVGRGQYVASAERLEATIEGLALGETTLTSLAVDGAYRAGDPKGSAAEPASSLEGFDALSARVEALKLHPDFVAATGVGLPLASPIQIDARVDGAPSALSFNIGAEVADAGRLDGDGTIDVPAQKYNGALRVAAFEPSEWVDWSLPSMLLNARASVEGVGTAFDDIKLQVGLDGQTSQLAGYQVDELSLRTKVENRRVDLTRLKLVSPYLSGTARGHLERAGDFELHLSGQTPKGGLPEAVAKRLGIKPEQLGKAEVVADVAGALDLETRVFPDVLEKLDVSGRWTMGAVDLKTTKIASSEGKLQVKLGANTSGRSLRPFSFQGRATFDGLSLPEYRLRDGRASANGKGRLRDEAATVVEALETISATGNLKFNRLEAPSVGAAGGDVTVRVNRVSPTADITYGVDGTVRGVQAQEYSAGMADLDVSGTMASKKEQTRFGVGGRVRATKLVGPTFSVGGLDSRLDVKGVLEEMAVVAGEDVVYDIDGTASEVAFGEETARELRVDLAGVLVPAVAGAAQTLERVNAEGTLGLRGAVSKARDVAVDQADLRLMLDGAPMVEGRALDYKISGTTRGVDYGRFRFGGLDPDLKGQVVPAGEGATWPLSRLAVDGSLAMRNVRALGVESKRIDTTLDLAGPMMALVGSVRSEFDSLGVGRTSFGSSTMTLGLKAERAFRFELRAEPAILPQLPFFLTMAGDYSDDLARFGLQVLEVGRPGWQWSMPESARLRVDGSTLTVESLALKTRGMTVRLDGTYDLGDSGSLVAMLSRLGMGPLGGLFDIEQLREQIPGGLGQWLEGQKAPADVKEKVKEEFKKVPEIIKEKLPGELRERIPDKPEKLPEQLKKLPGELKKKVPKEKGAGELEKRLPEGWRPSLPGWKPGQKKSDEKNQQGAPRLDAGQAR